MIFSLDKKHGAASFEIMPGLPGESKGIGNNYDPMGHGPSSDYVPKSKGMNFDPTSNF